MTGRRIQYIICAIGVLLLFLLVGCGPTKMVTPDVAMRTVRSDDGAMVDIPVHPKRVLTLGATFDTILLGVANLEDIRAVSSLSKYEDYSLEAKRARQVKDHMRTYSLESLIKLKPDLVIAPHYASKDIVDGLRGMGIPIVVVDAAKDVETVKSNVVVIADLVGHKERGEAMVASIEADIQWMRQRWEHIPLERRKSVLFVSSMDGYTGAGSMFEDMCRYMGVINAPTEMNYVPRTSFTDERVIEMNPDYLFIPSYKGMDKRLEERFTKTAAFQSLRAMKEGHVMPMKAAYLYTGNQHIGTAMKEIMKTVYESELDE